MTAAVGRSLSGDREGGQRDLLGCWSRADDRHAAMRCVLAHYLADLQETVDAEVAWDERALDAYAGVAPDDLRAVGIESATGLAPSLHLNLGDGYRRQGRLERARAQLTAGQAAASVLPDDGYADTIRRGLERLADRLDRTEHAGT